MFRWSSRALEVSDARAARAYRGGTEEVGRAAVAGRALGPGLSMTDEAGGADSENPCLNGSGIKTTAKLEGDESMTDECIQEESER